MAQFFQGYLSQVHFPPPRRQDSDSTEGPKCSCEALGLISQASGLREATDSQETKLSLELSLLPLYCSVLVGLADSYPGNCVVCVCLCVCEICWWPHPKEEKESLCLLASTAYSLNREASGLVCGGNGTGGVRNYFHSQAGNGCWGTKNRLKTEKLMDLWELHWEGHRAQSWPGWRHGLEIEVEKVYAILW